MTKKEYVSVKETDPNRQILDNDISHIKVFNTEPKIRRLVLRKQQTVRNRAYALQESFYPTKDVSYNAVKIRMATLLGIVDRTSILAYLGRPAHRTKQIMDQTVKYPQATVQKTHRFYRKLSAKKGYIEIFGLGYVYLLNDEWRVHWNHTEQLTLCTHGYNDENPPTPPTEIDERVEVFNAVKKSSKEDFSLSYNILQGKECEKTVLEVVSPCKQQHIVRDREERECFIRERNCESESNQSFSIKHHNIGVKLFAEK